MFIITYIGWLGAPPQWRSVAVTGHANIYILITDWLNEMNWQAMEALEAMLMDDGFRGAPPLLSF